MTRAGMRTPTLLCVDIRTPCGRCKGVVHFHEEPVLIAASFAAHADEHETALELLAVQRKLQSACCNAFYHRLICPQVVVGTLIPDGHCTGPILPFWNRARECGIGERVVFDLDGQTLVRRIRRGAFRNSPALEHALHFQAEIVMQSARMVLLHNKNRSISMAFFLRGQPGQWGRGGSEISLVAICFEGHMHLSSRAEPEHA